MASDGTELRRLLRRTDLPDDFERWCVVLEPGAERPTSGAEWSGAMVLIEQGRLEVDCAGAGRREFDEGDLLVLGWLPLRRLRNAGDVAVRLLAIRRTGDRPKEAFLEVIHHEPTDTER